MKISTTLAMTVILIGRFSLRLIAGGDQVNGALADLQTALELDRRGQYREALQRYRTFLSHPGVQITPLLHAYILKQEADVDNGLGDYSKAEVNTREALRLLAAANATNTSTFATAEGVLADALDGGR